MLFTKGNTYSVGNTGGRPAHFSTPEELEKTVIEFFEDCIKDKVKPTITGLTLYLGFESRSSLDDYVKRTPEFSYIVKRAKLAVENSYEQHGNTIDIFALKNMGWSDRTDLNMSGHLNTSGVDLSKLSDSALKEIADAQYKHTDPQ